MRPVKGWTVGQPQRNVTGDERTTAGGAVVIEASDALGVWTPLHTVPLTAPGPAIDLPVNPTGPRFFRAIPWR